MKIAPIVLLLLLPFLCFAQVTADSRLADVFESSYLSNLSDNHPLILQRYNYFLDNAYFIDVHPKGKAQLNVPVIKLDANTQFNIIAVMREHKLKTSPDKRLYYRIENSDKVLVFYSTREFDTNFKNSLH
ncbi:MAG: hypothetical protein KA101_01650 [Saprospiraceae bacterium]|nr:hypothetical protein [Saprospiraceae bacterium]